MDLQKQLKAINAALQLEALAQEDKLLSSRISIQRQILTENCQHESLSKKENYIVGTYSNKSYVMITETCDLCSKVIRHYEKKNHYGNYA